MDRPELCEESDEEEGGVEDEEEDPVAPAQVEAAQRDGDEGQDQGQPQSSREDPRQQALCFKLRRGRGVERTVPLQNRPPQHARLLILRLT